MYTVWEDLKNACLGCTKCPLCEGRTNLVFGCGNTNAEVMLIGEGPGQNEDLQGLPFVGRSGKLLDSLLAEVDLSRDKNIYIANMVKCRPPQNRDPAGEEIAALTVDSQVLDLSAAGRYVAVLYTSSLVIYDRSLRQCAVLEDVNFARRVLMRSDGSAVLAGTNSASLYLP